MLWLLRGRLANQLYAILIQFFDDGDGSRSGYVVKAFLAYWLFWCMLPNSLEDILNLYVFLWPYWSRRGFNFLCMPCWMSVSLKWSSLWDVRCGHTHRLVLPPDVCQSCSLHWPQNRWVTEIVIEEAVFLDGSRRKRPSNTYQPQLSGGLTRKRPWISLWWR